MPAIEGTPFPAVAVAEIPDSAKVEMVFPVEETTYTIADGKITKAGSTGGIKEASEVEGANTEVTPYLLEQWKAGNGGFGAIYGLLGKTLAAPEEAAAAPDDEYA